MEPENTPLEEETHLPSHHFRFYVNLRGCMCCFSTLCVVSKQGLKRIDMLEIKGHKKNDVNSHHDLQAYSVVTSTRFKDMKLHYDDQG